MAEISFDVNELNGAAEQTAPVTVALDATLPRVDPIRNVFITSVGREIQLTDKQIKAVTVQFLQNQGKPKIPMVEVTLMGKHKQLEPHAGHEGYQARLQEWEEESGQALLRYLFNVGVKGQPPPEFLEEYAYYTPDATTQELKYLWVGSMLEADDIEPFATALIEQVIPTQKGLEESAHSFRRDG